MASNTILKEPEASLKWEDNCELNNCRRAKLRYTNPPLRFLRLLRVMMWWAVCYVPLCPLFCYVRTRSVMDFHRYIVSARGHNGTPGTSRYVHRSVMSAVLFIVPFCPQKFLNYICVYTLMV